MAHLTHFGLDNFRVFEEPTLFEFRPITILTGTNSSGKSSLIKGLLTAKNLLQGHKFIEQSYWTGEIPTINTWFIEEMEIPYSLKIGDFLSTKNNRTNHDNIKIDLPIKLTNIEDLFILTLSYKPNPNKIGFGIIHEMILKHNSIEVLTCINYLENNWKIKINFSLLKNSLEKQIKKAEQIFDLNNKIKLLKNNSDEKSKIEIQTLEAMQIEISPSLARVIQDQNVELTSQSEFKGSFSFPSPMFQTDIFYSYFEKEFFLKYNKNFSLLYYSFLFKENDLVDFYKDKFENQDDFLDFLNTNKKILDEYHNQSIETPIDEKELAWFDSLIFDSKTKYKSDLSHHLWELTKGTTSESDIIEHLRLKESPMQSYIPSAEYILVDKSISIKRRAEQNINYLISNVLINGLGKSLNTLSKGFSRMEYLPSIRNITSRIFLYDGDSVFKNILKFITTHQMRNSSKDFIKRQILNFEIAENIEFKKLPDGIGTKVVLIKETQEIDLADVGYGISQVLPIILQIAIQIESNETLAEYPNQYDQLKLPCSLIIEEPETNLHPALQSKLADMFVECYKKYNIQLIIETHSEYLIRKLQYLTGKGEIEPEMTQLYYFHHPDKIPEGEKQIKKINIQKDGSLTDDFGTGFFDEATNWKFELTRLKNSQKN